MNLKILVTGGAGFIGSEFVKQVLPIASEKITVIDSLNYAGSLANLQEVISEIEFINLDIRNRNQIQELFTKNNFEKVINFAAETHVDNSISGPRVFFETNILGTSNLLEASLATGVELFFQISTDEVYGSIRDGFHFETSEMNPSSPYAASKASAEMIVNSFKQTYKLGTLVARCSNNYGPNQFPEKFIPYSIKSLISGNKVQLYGTGLNVREWIHVTDTCNALIKILLTGKIGSVYNVSSGDFKNNIEVFQELCTIMGISHDRFEFVNDRAGHDFRYAMDSSKIRNELGWAPSTNFREGLRKTVEWYLFNQNRFQKW